MDRVPGEPSSAAMVPPDVPSTLPNDPPERAAHAASAPQRAGRQHPATGSASAALRMGSQQPAPGPLRPPDPSKEEGSHVLCLVPPTMRPTQDQSGTSAEVSIAESAEKRSRIMCGPPTTRLAEEQSYGAEEQGGALHVDATGLPPLGLAASPLRRRLRRWRAARRSNSKLSGSAACADGASSPAGHHADTGLAGALSTGLGAHEPCGVRSSGVLESLALADMAAATLLRESRIGPLTLCSHPGGVKPGVSSAWQGSAFPDAPGAGSQGLQQGFNSAYSLRAQPGPSEPMPQFSSEPLHDSGSLQSHLSGVEARAPAVAAREQPHSQIYVAHSAGEPTPQALLHAQSRALAAGIALPAAAAPAQPCSAAAREAARFEANGSTVAGLLAGTGPHLPGLPALGAAVHVAEAVSLPTLGPTLPEYPGSSHAGWAATSPGRDEELLLTAAMPAFGTAQTPPAEARGTDVQAWSLSAPTYASAAEGDAVRGHAWQLDQPASSQGAQQPVFLGRPCPPSSEQCCGGTYVAACWPC